MASNKKFEVEATLRQVTGKGACHRLRGEEKVPGIVYGGGKEPVKLTFDHNKLARSLANEAFYSRILTLTIDAEKERVVLKDVQRHAFKPRILHIDFQRVRADEKLYMTIPLHFKGAEQAPGVKEGGLVSHIESDVEIACLPDDLPEYIEVDISAMQLNDILHLSDLKLPKGVEVIALTQEDDKPIVSVHIPRVEEEPVVEVAPEGEVAPTEVPAIAQKGEAEAGPQEKKGQKEEKK